LKPFLILFLGLVFVLASILVAYKLKQTQMKIGAEMPASFPTIAHQPSQEPTTDGWKKYNFQPLELNLKVPESLIVHTEELDSGNGFIAYIQNYPYNSPYPENAYQLYIIWQKIPRVTKEEFQLLKEDLIADSIENANIGDYPVIKGQIKGERNRFVTYIFKDSSVIKLATSEPTQINKELTDKILSTFVFVRSSNLTPISSAKILNYVSKNCKISFSYLDTFEFDFNSEKRWDSSCADKNDPYPGLDLALKSRNSENDVQIQIMFRPRSGDYPPLIDGLDVPIGQEVKIWPNDFLIKVSEVSLGGVRAIRMQGTGFKILGPTTSKAGDYNISLVRAIKNGVIYEIHSQFERGTDEVLAKQYDDLFDLIVSTFKFLD
jgi:hypothetical protein